MKKTSRRYSEIKTKTEDTKFNLDDAVKLLKECANAKFDEAIEFHIKTNATTFKNIKRNLQIFKAKPKINSWKIAEAN